MVLSANVHKLNNSKAVAYATIVIEEDNFRFIIKDIYLKYDEDGLRTIEFPKRKDLKNESKYISLGFPMNNETRNQLIELVWDEYDKKYGLEKVGISL